MTDCLHICEMQRQIRCIKRRKVNEIAEFCSLLDTGEYLWNYQAKIDCGAGPSQPSLLGQKPDTLNEFTIPLKFLLCSVWTAGSLSKYKSP